MIPLWWRSGMFIRFAEALSTVLSFIMWYITVPRSFQGSPQSISLDIGIFAHHSIWMWSLPCGFPFNPFFSLDFVFCQLVICHWVPKLCFLLMANRIPRCPFGKGKQVSLARLQKLMVLNRCLHLIFRMFKFLECLKTKQWYKVAQKYARLLFFFFFWCYGLNLGLCAWEDCALLPRHTPTSSCHTLIV